jgi:kynureninase
MKRAVNRAEKHDCFNEIKQPIPENEIIKIKARHNGLYHTTDIIDVINLHANQIQMICLSDIVFSTGQRLELNKVFSALTDVIKKNNIYIILDLAHTVGNRHINLESMPITAAVGCAYKHLSGYAGSAFGIYVNRNIDLDANPPLQGWKVASSKKVFEKINSYDASIIDQTIGATAFRTSNPSPLALLPAQTYLTEFGKIGFYKFFNKSECLTRYLIMQLQHHLNDEIEIITPLDPKQRGATLAVRMKESRDIQLIEKELKKYGFEIDCRPPDILRMTAHYGYIKFTHIQRFVAALKNVLITCKEKQSC